MVTITTLIDNSAPFNKKLASEHGLAFLIEKGNKKILFDTGASGAFIKNGQLLDKDLSSLDHIVISHRHWDHGGGLMPLLDKYTYPSLKLWSGKGFEKEKYGDDGRVLGLSITRQDLNRHKVMWHSVCSDTVMLYRGVWLLTDFKRHSDTAPHNPRFRLEDGSVDPFEDEVALLVDTPKGLILIVGCSHPGILNIVDTAMERFNRPFYALLGGIHLSDASAERRAEVVNWLLASPIEYLGLCHCSGKEAIEMVKKHHKRFLDVRSGFTLTIV
ncbi:MAG: MBL fold metallo-hydrolase [Sphaerochaetaceae bacterium]